MCEKECPSNVFPLYRMLYVKIFYRISGRVEANSNSSGMYGLYLV